MKTKISIDRISFRTPSWLKKQPGLSRTQKKVLPVGIVSTVLLLAGALLFLPVTAFGQGHEGGGESGGGGGCGDVFGDLIHIKRNLETGQPVFVQRWVELPAEVQGYGWGYCPIAIYDDQGITREIPFLPYSCDMDPDFAEFIQEVDYFGRLNAGRTKERNNRMHLDEVISNIKAADQLKLDPTGRLMMGYDCVVDGDCIWSTVDSPMENMALYVRMMKYGHIATDPYEVNEWAHGDPKLPTQFHPALDQDDWAKFGPEGSPLRNLLPNKEAQDCWIYGLAEKFTDANGDGIWNPAEPYMDINKDGMFNPVHPRPEPFTDLNGNGVWDPAEEFTDKNDNGVADEFAFKCAGTEKLDNADFMSSSVMLGAAANKTGKITVDLVQYLNRFLKITQDTPATLSTRDTLTAQYLDCWKSKAAPFDPVEGEELVDPLYDYCVAGDTHDCEIIDYSLCKLETVKTSSNNLPDNWDLFPNIMERFVDFKNSEYHRDYRSNAKADLILESGIPGNWYLSNQTDIMSFVEFVYPSDPPEKNIDNFVGAASDALRSIEFIHNYAVPADLYCVYDESECE